MVARWLALAFYLRGCSRHCPRDRHCLLFNGLACAGAVVRNDERDWLVGELQTELQAKKKIRDHTILQAFCDRHVLLLTVSFFLASLRSSWEYLLDPHLREAPFGIPSLGSNNAAENSSSYWYCWGGREWWHSDKSAERRLHTAIPLLVAGVM